MTKKALHEAMSRGPSMLALLLALLSCWPATAQGRPRPPQAHDAAQKYINVGTSLFKKGRFQEALQAFQKAKALVADPRLLYYVGRSHEELRRPVEALRAYQEILESAPGSRQGPKALQAIARLRERWFGRLAIRCKPERAAVELDGMPQGRCPLALADILSGRHRLKVLAPGYKERSWQVEVRANDEVKVVVELEPETVRVHVTTSPSGAKVELDGRPAGRAPLTSMKISPGEHRFRFTHEGYRDETRTVDLAPGTPGSLEVSLQPKQVAPVGTASARPAGGPSTTFWVAASASAALLGTGMLFGLLANSNEAEANRMAESRSGGREEWEAVRDRTEIQATLSNVALVGSSVSVLTALLVLWMESDTAADQGQTTARLTLGPGWVGLTVGARLGAGCNGVLP